MAKPRKKYKPRPVLINPVGYVLEGVRPPDPGLNEVAALHVANHTAATHLAKGLADRQDMDFLVTMSNMTEVMWRMGFGTGYEDVLKAGQDALIAICQRGKDTNRFIAKGPELTAVNALIELHDAQYSVISVSELAKALHHVKAEIQAKRFRRIG